ncbi:hypothetical protein OIDMADRAFT_103267 [Oidiodendron maius Zn]|uniref:Large ribosomal subunit protein mL50 n=1 Tax=Oidiodendron maius (strain Zn) TaxID=913774 RepID=A0A0C3HFU1_OIDMZ|nr:hypothetical protein OIDMADRAFT_103267 [Oidiodendron maius Zn]
MRRVIRIDRSVDLLRLRAVPTKPSPYLCASCIQQATSFSTSSSRPEDKKITIHERLRRKIWGTDQPPGQENPYVNAGVYDQNNRAQDEELAENEGQQKKLVTMADLDPSYVPATNWDGLERVGGFGHWWKQNWDPEHQFEGFLPREIATDGNAITVSLHRAMVEVFALREAGIPLSEVSKTISTWDPTTFVQITPAVTGARLQFLGNSSLNEVVQSLTPATGETDETAVKENPSESEEDVAADRSTVDPLHPQSSEEVDETAEKGDPSESEADVAADRSTVDPLHRDKLQTQKSADVKSASALDISESWDPAWFEVSIEEPEVKFAVLKRTMQLTGIRIPDPVIRSSNTAEALLRHLITPPKPTKLAEALKQRPDLVELPNVSIFGRRQTPVDKERKLGRWKVIEEELKKRGLPYHNHLDVAGEGRWL